MKKLIYFLLFYILFFAEAAFPFGFVTGNELLKGCQQHVNAPASKSAAQCEYYILGIVDVYEELFNLNALPRVFCLPGNSTPEQYIRIILKYLSAAPEDLHFAAQGQVVLAMRDAFPCKEVYR